MNLPFYEEEQEEEELSEIAPDTPLPNDLATYLKERTQQRQRVIATTERVTVFFTSWSLNATGFFVARFLLFTGGAINFWLAVSLCFSLCSVSSLVGLTDFRLNYNEGVQIDNMQRLVGSVGGFLIAGSVTFLAVKDYQEFQYMTYQTAQEIQRGIDSIEGQHPELSPWLTIAVSLAIIGMTFSFVCRRQ